MKTKIGGNTLNVLFMGTPEFAVPCLENIINSNYNICGVFTQPDKKKGRGQMLSAPPVKEFALHHGIDVFQPTSLKNEESFEIIKKLNPDIIVVVAYGKILPERIINFPKYGCINVHASLLPKYRGAAPIQWSIINGESKTGITTMYMDKGLDTGDMLLKDETLIDENENSSELSKRLSQMGANLIVKTLKALENGNLERIKQDDSLSSYASMLDKTMCKIDFNKTAFEVHNLVRGLNSWPIACTTLNGKNLKIYKTKVIKNVKGIPGEVKSCIPFIVCCNNNTAVEIVELQFEGKRRMNAEDFMRGYRDKDRLTLS